MKNDAVMLFINVLWDFFLEEWTKNKIRLKQRHCSSDIISA